MRTKKSVPFITLRINGKFKDFSDFYDENKDIIYENILNVFKEFKNTRKKSLVLHVSAKIMNVDWETEFIFHREESIVLKRDLIPYFEKIEDYEKCNEIKNIYLDLIK